MRKMYIQGVVFNKSKRDYKGKEYYGISIDTGFNMPTIVNVDKDTYDSAIKGEEITLICDFFIDYDKKRLSLYIK